MDILGLCHTLEREGMLSPEEFLFILDHVTPREQAVITARARAINEARFDKTIYTRGLIELSSYCKNDCYYCGLRRSNQRAIRYRLTRDEILSSAQHGYDRGFRTFVLQGGEDPYFTDTILCDILTSLKNRFPQCAITLSLGERSALSYGKLKAAGADRYLLRQETITSHHYSQLHPPEMSLETRVECLEQLKRLGYQVGTGMMVGSPHQTHRHLAADLSFIANFRPQMVGIGPFLPHSDTPFHGEAKGSLQLTLLLLSLLRIMDENLLLPATTALATLHPEGRKLGLLAGANVIMPNTSPLEVRKNYMLYNDKVAFGEELLEENLVSLGYALCRQRGDYKRRKPL